MCDHGDRENPKKELERPREKLAQLIQNIFSEPSSAGRSPVAVQQPRSAFGHSIKASQRKPFRIALCRTGSSRAGLGSCRSLTSCSINSYPGDSRPGSPHLAAQRLSFRKTRSNTSLVKSSKTFTESDPKLLFAGRYLTKVERADPFEVSKRFVGPHLQNNIDDYPDPERIVRKIFGIRDLKNVLLLITPSFERQKDKHILHGYEIDSQKHLGVTSLTSIDRELFERFHDSSNYSIMYCSIYLELRDAYMNEQIREKIFSSLSMQSMVPVGSFYKGRMITLKYRKCLNTKKPVKPLLDSGNSILNKIPDTPSEVTQYTPESSIILPMRNKTQTMVAEENIVPEEVTQESKDEFSETNENLEKTSKTITELDCTEVDLENKIYPTDELKSEDQEQKIPIMIVSKTDAKEKRKQEKPEEKSVKKPAVFKGSSKRDDIKNKNPQVDMAKRIGLNNEPSKKHTVPKSYAPKSYVSKKYYLNKVLSKPNDLNREETKKKPIKAHKEAQPKQVECKKLRQPIVATAPISRNLIKKEPRTMLNKPEDPKVHTKIKQPKPFERNLMPRKSVETKIKSTIQSKSQASQAKKSFKEMDKKKTVPQQKIPAEGILSPFESMKLSQKIWHPNQVVHSSTDERRKVIFSMPSDPDRQIKNNAAKRDAPLTYESKIPVKLEAPKKSIGKTTLDSKKMPRIVHSIASQHSLKSQVSNVPINFRRRIYGRWRDEFKTIHKARRLYESKGAIHMPSILAIPKVQFHNTSSVIEAKSVLFERLMEPITLPDHFSERACAHIRSRLYQIEAKLAFLKFDKLMQKINKGPVPRYRHLMTFFKFVRLLDIKLFVREEICWPGFAPALEPRYQVECYVFDDRQDFIVSFALLCRQLQEFAEGFPDVRRNLRYIDDAFELTILPSPITKCMRYIMNSLHSKRLFKFFAEITYDFIQPLPKPVNVIKEIAEPPEEDENIIQQAKRMDEVLKILKEEYAKKK